MANGMETIRDLINPNRNEPLFNYITAVLSLDELPRKVTFKSWREFTYQGCKPLAIAMGTNPKNLCGMLYNIATFTDGELESLKDYLIEEMIFKRTGAGSHIPMTLMFNLYFAKYGTKVVMDGTNSTTWTFEFDPSTIEIGVSNGVESSMIIPRCQVEVQQKLKSAPITAKFDFHVSTHFPTQPLRTTKGHVDKALKETLDLVYNGLRHNFTFPTYEECLNFMKIALKKSPNIDIAYNLMTQCQKSALVSESTMNEIVETVSDVENADIVKSDEGVVFYITGRTLFVAYCKTSNGYVLADSESDFVKRVILAMTLSK